jgi:hypothetical protein
VRWHLYWVVLWYLPLCYAGDVGAYGGHGFHGVAGWRPGWRVMPMYVVWLKFHILKGHCSLLRNLFYTVILYFVNFILTHINMSRFWLQSEEKLLVRLVMHREQKFIIMADLYHSRWWKIALKEVGRFK